LRTRIIYPNTVFKKPTDESFGKHTIIKDPDNHLISLAQIRRKPIEDEFDLWIYHWHPVLLLGYIAILEGYPFHVEQMERIQRKTKFPDSAFRTMYMHSNLDLDQLLLIILAKLINNS
jgi:hypothetical protein